MDGQARLAPNGCIADLEGIAPSEKCRGAPGPLSLDRRLSKEVSVKKTHWNAIIDALLVSVMLIVMWIGVLLGFFIGRGAVPQAEKYLWGLHRHDWGDIHLYFSLALVALVVLHFILHMSWVRCMSRQCLRLHWIVTLFVLILLAAAFLWAAVAFKRSHPGDYEQEEHGRSPGGRRGRQSEQEGLLPGEGVGRGLGGAGGRGLTNR